MSPADAAVCVDPVEAVATCLREGGQAYGLDAEQWTDVLLMSGEAQDLYNSLADLLKQKPKHLVQTIRTIAEG